MEEMLINRELSRQINSMVFPNSEILISGREKWRRRFRLNLSVFVNRFFSKEAIIFFSDTKSEKKIRLTILKITDHFVIVNNGAFIPIHRISFVQPIGIKRLVPFLLSITLTLLLLLI